MKNSEWEFPLPDELSIGARNALVMGWVLCILVYTFCVQWFKSKTVLFKKQFTTMFCGWILPILVMLSMLVKNEV